MQEVISTKTVTTRLIQNFEIRVELEKGAPVFWFSKIIIHAHPKGTFLGAYSRIGITGISQTIVCCLATLIPELL